MNLPAGETKDQLGAGNIVQELESGSKPEQLPDHAAVGSKQKRKVKIPLRAFRNILLAITLLILGIGVGYGLATSSSPSYGYSSLSADNSSGDLDMRMFWQVKKILETTYLEPEKMEDEKMVYGAIEGLTDSLGDPYTVFLPPTDNKRSKEDLNGAFEGVGIQLGYKKDTIAVMSPLEEMPAIKKGVKAGDLIINIKDEAREIDEDTIDMTLQEAVKLIRGPKGTPVTLTLYREGKGSFDVEIVRDTIVVASVEYEFGDWEGEEWVENEKGSVVWVKLRRFGDRTEGEWDKMVDDVIRNGDQVSGLIVDVRNNPGGYLRGAIDLASEFVPDGVIVKQQGRYDTENYGVSKRGRLLNMPVVVLMNGGSASASEILAGALRDRIQAPLVGERSFGKGTVQEAPDLAGGAGLHITIARWLLPSGDWIHENGLEPNYEMELPDMDEVLDELKDAQEASESSSEDDEELDIDIKDTQLEEAVRVLKETVGS